MLGVGTRITETGERQGQIWTSLGNNGLWSLESGAGLEGGTRWAIADTLKRSRKRRGAQADSRTSELICGKG